MRHELKIIEVTTIAKKRIKILKLTFSFPDIFSTQCPEFQ